MVKPDKAQRLDRQSGTGTRGLPKKDGLKGWGRSGEQEEVLYLDENDPNYVAPEEEGTEGSEDARFDESQKAQHDVTVEFTERTSTDKVNDPREMEGTKTGR